MPSKRLVDVLTADAHGVPRRLTETVEPGTYYPNHVAIDFYHRYREDVTDGLENAPRAFIGMLEGRNFGKQLVRVGADPA